MQLFTTTAVTLLLSLVSSTLAAPVADTQVQHSKKFKLKSHSLSSSTSAFENLYLEPYHIYPAFNYATLYPKTARDPGIIGFLNGTKQELEDDQGDLIFNLGQAGIYGFVIDRVNSTYNPIEINAGTGTKGIYINQGVIKYNNPISGGFYACNSTLLYGPAVQLFFKPKFITTPTGCEDVQLVVEYV